MSICLIRLSQEKMIPLGKTILDHCLKDVEMEKQMTVSEEFPCRIKELRQSLGWSQGQIAKKVGADVQRISKYERGVIKPTADMIVKMASVFNVSLDYLLLDNPEQNIADIDIQNIKSKDLLEKLRKLQELSGEDQKAVTLVLDAFIQKHGIKKPNDVPF